MSLFDNPTIAASVGAIAGAILSAIVSVIIWRRTLKRKQVDCLIHDVSSLLSVSEKIQQQLEIKYENQAVNAVYFVSLEIVNSGNQAVKKQPVLIRMSENSRVIDYSVATEPPVGFGEINRVGNDDNGLGLVVDLLNPGDRVFLEVVSIDNIDESIDVFLKNANVTTRVIHTKGSDLSMSDLTSDKGMMWLAILSSVPLFGGFARSVINVGLAQRIDRIGKRN